MERAVFAGQPDGDAHERGNAGAVDLRDAVEIDDDLVCAAPDDGLQGVSELVARLADGEAAVDFEQEDSAGFADVNLHWGTFSHGIGFEQLSDHAGLAPSSPGPGGGGPRAEMHYTMTRARNKESIAEISERSGAMGKTDGTLNAARR
jgi:hypothetical protein